MGVIKPAVGEKEMPQMTKKAVVWTWSYIRRAGDSGSGVWAQRLARSARPVGSCVWTRSQARKPRPSAVSSSDGHAAHTQNAAKQARGGAEL